ncbi:MAG: two-component system, chemotaxis family, sensor kinase CheA [Sphingomonadales bacterium]|jgi:two-component system chemotaxis sensor kinase CheA|nr:two-component system, chemotaxis family, sensor kinase CheA [Sphingomonadales bacterium]
MDELLKEFIAETREMLAAIGGEIVAWEAQPGDRARLDAIFRFVHTVKGNSGFFDLPRIAALSHAAEDALAAVRSGARGADPRLVSAVLAAIDRIGELVQALESGDVGASLDDEPLIQALGSAPGPTPAAAAAATAPQPQRATTIRTIRLPVDLLDRMMSGVSDLVLARNELARGLREAGPGGDVSACFDRVSGCIGDLRDAVTRTRMQRIDQLFSALPRMVRDLCAETGKQIALTIDGGDVELDREMIEMIRDPLTHIVRNAVDHGIEPPEARRAGGKPEAGSLAVRACQAGNQILIDIADDGRGVDGERLVARALATGTLTAERAARLTPAQKIALIFEPGLSTAAEVTALSGRGVGMDVVRANVERIGGLVDVHSRAGEGLTLTLRVPLTLTIIPALTVGAAGQSFALPRSAIEEIVRVKGGAARIERVGGARMVTLRGRRLPLVSLPELIGGKGAAEEAQSLVVLRPAGGGTFALAVDAVHDHEELVVKPAAPVVMAAGLYAGTTIAGDGRPVLLLDPPGLADRARVTPAADGAEDEHDSVDAAARVQSWLLCRTLSGVRRLVPVTAVERIEDVPAEAVALTAGRLHVTVGESILPLEGCPDVPDHPLRLLRLTDGATEIAYAVAEIADIVSLAPQIVPAAGPGEALGVCRIGGQQAEVIDLHWLFARHAKIAGAAAEFPVCVLPQGDPFMETILRPLVESAGYRVVCAADADAAKAEIVIVGAESKAPSAAAGARLVRLRAAVEAKGRRDDSIHRYDRAALLAALAREAKG